MSPATPPRQEESPRRRITDAGGYGIHSIDQKEEDLMSVSTTVVPPAVIPKDVEPMLVVPRELLVGLEKQPLAEFSLEFGVCRAEDGGTVFIVPGEEPMPHHVGDPYTLLSGEPATWMGTYEVIKTMPGTVIGILLSKFPCTSLPADQCTGHECDSNGIVDSSRHEGPDLDIARIQTLPGDAKVYAMHVIDGGRRLLNISLPNVEAELDQQALLFLSNELEAIVGELRTIADDLTPPC